MNAKALIPVVTALIGFAVGWTSHHTPEPAPDASHNTPAPPSPKTRSANADAAAFREHHGYQKAAPGEEASATVPPVNQAPYVQTFVAAAAHRDKARADRLAEALGLDEAQRQRLNEIIEQHKTDDQGPPPRTPREIIDQKARAAASIDGEINQILTPEQKGAYEAMKSRQVKNQIESRAQRELASLGDRIDMSPEQRDAALQALRANAAAKPPLDAGLLGTSSSNPNGGLFADMLADAAADNPDLDMLTDPFALHREMAQLQIRQIEEKVARMAAVLTPAQLAQYRASLEADASFLQSAAPPMPNK
jgi:hypothetical protein